MLCKEYNFYTFIQNKIFILKINKMKNFFTIILLSLSIFSYSQADSTVAVDFTITDTDGVEPNLFGYLDNGKHVILQFFTVEGCATCTEQAEDFSTTYMLYGCNEHDIIFLGITAFQFLSLNVL